jgi:hypothetical protein
MVRNVEGLKRSARSRSAETMERATAAMRLMHSEEMEINFRSVAARAQSLNGVALRNQSSESCNHESTSYFAVCRRREFATSATALT